MASDISNTACSECMLTYFLADVFTNCLPDWFNIVEIANEKVMVDFSAKMSWSEEMYTVQVCYVYTPVKCTARTEYYCYIILYGFTFAYHCLFYTSKYSPLIKAWNHYNLINFLCILAPCIQKQWFYCYITNYSQQIFYCCTHILNSMHAANAK